MAFAKKCDICGKLYEVYNMKQNSEKTNGIMFLNIDETRSYYSHRAIDCCPECMKSIKDHIEELKDKTA